MMRKLLHLAAVKIGGHEAEDQKQDSRYAPSFVSLYEIRSAVVREMLCSHPVDAFPVRVERVIRQLVRGVTSVDVHERSVTFCTRNVQADFAYSITIPSSS